MKYITPEKTARSLAIQKKMGFGIEMDVIRIDDMFSLYGAVFLVKR